MNNYDTFAHLYDQVVGDRGEVALFIRRLIRSYTPKAKRVLELGCGSGTMLQHLSKHYVTTGIDNSRKMLTLAKRKAPRAKLILGDITDFSLAESFDAVVCPFDTMNHITSLAKWRKVFENAHKHLSSNGVFIFDVNTEFKMEMYRKDPITVDPHKAAFSTVDVQRIRRYRYMVNLTLYKEQRRDLFKRYQMSIPELVVPTQIILRELATYFRTVIMIDPDRLRPSSGTEELFFICRRPR